MENILRHIREPLEVSVLMHLLITLSYLCRDRFRKSMEQVNMSKKIQEFVEFYDGISK
jgi:hypothetical protein